MKLLASMIGIRLLSVTNNFFLYSNKESH